MVLISGDADRWIDYLDSDQMDQALYCHGALKIPFVLAPDVPVLPFE